MEPIAENSNQLAVMYKGFLRSLKEVISTEDHHQIHNIFNLLSSFTKDYPDESWLPRISHQLNVAKICIKEIGLGKQSILAILLVDVAERNKLSFNDIENEFGENISRIVRDYSKISSIEIKDPKSQADNYVKLLLSFTNDARVILIKIADHLETMRSLDKFPAEIKQKKSLESFHLYAPIAHKIGLYKIKSELEDLAMKFTYSKDYNSIVSKLKNTNAKRNRFIRDFIAPFEEELKQRGFDFEIKGRPKSIYSIWKKMQKQGVEFEEVYDVFAIRIILNSPPDREKSDCWQVFSIITDRYTPNPERMRDWISVPKSTGYESLHTTVLGPEGKFVEVQIRTTRMDELAEKGLAAHWKYKGIQQEQGFDEWFNKVREILESTDSKPDIISNSIDTNIYSKEVFVFTPKGDIRKLPLNSTVLDFAFDIHSNVGAKCTGAKVNNRIVSIKHILKNGDIVEVLTSKNQTPKEDWLKFVVTSKAKGKIKQSIREERNREISNGKEILLRRLKNWKIENHEEAIKLILKNLRLKNSALLFAQIAAEKIDVSDLKAILTQIDKPVEQVIEADKPLRKEDEKSTFSSDDYLLIDEKFVNIDYKLAKCCNPIFGDQIFGFVTINEGIKIHRTSCPNARQLKSRWGYRMVKARWKSSIRSSSFQTTIKISGIDELGIVNRITELISKDLKVNMRDISFNSSNGAFEGQVQVFVPDIKHLEMLLYRLTKIKGVQRAVRLK